MSVQTCAVSGSPPHRRRREAAAHTAGGDANYPTPCPHAAREQGAIQGSVPHRVPNPYEGVYATAWPCNRKELGCRLRYTPQWQWAV
jgi:hypothetical protein